MICGDFGGRTEDGQPCGRRVIDSCCHDHERRAAEELAEAKAVLLELYASGAVSLLKAGAEVGAGRTTVWRWRQADPEFDAAVNAIQATLEEKRFAMLEEATFEQILAGAAPGNVHIWYMQNLSRRVRPGHFVDVRQHHISGPNGGPITGILGVVSGLTPDEIERLQALPPEERRKQLHLLRSPA